MENRNSNVPSSNTVGAVLIGIVALAALFILMFTDHPIKPIFLVLGLLIMAVGWLAVRKSGNNGIAVSVIFAVALIVTFLAI